MRDHSKISDRIAHIGRATSGFDYLRVCLASAVLLWHSHAVVHGYAAGQAVQAGPLGLLPRLVLPMFFALSGFLVASSLERARSLPIFLVYRAMRLLPALAVEVALSAVIIGPLVSQVPADQYFGDPLFARYLLNTVGAISFHLPGVFETNPWPSIVNASLWTVPYELECYVLLVAVQVLTLTRRPVAITAVTIVLSVALLIFSRKHSVGAMAFDPVPGRMLVLSFLAGVSIFAARMHIPYSAPLAGLALGLGALCLSHPALQFLAPLPIAYATVWLGLRDPKRSRLLLGGDYSYGLYLYGFVIQQCLMHFLGDVLQSTLALFASALLATALFAFGSWHAIEEPILRLKRRIPSPSFGTYIPRLLPSVAGARPLKEPRGR